MEIKVAIFEDNNNMREGLYQLINGSQGFTCTGAFPNCDDLVKRIEKSNPDVIVMDIEMPGISGIEGVKLVKENFPEMKILMETIFEDDKKIFDSICAGAEGYILKNTPPVEILGAIKEIYEGGSPMTPTIANRVLKMVKTQRPSDSKNLFNLTDREKEILSCLVEGMSYKLIADECTISIDTVNVHIKNIYKKLQVHSKSEAVAKAIKGKIV
ncbi:MAG TPA: response regulator transcription factor [Chitinophagaceae bacterium]|nr:response regulator transcription factor [Chitinophagaceae bacterium]